ncbi:MAG: hypothetical protein H6924_11170 [Alphaproteobacteria bacterium]|nr:hypothetical protein [Alphaproteobacteria bacterium]
MFRRFSTFLSAALFSATCLAGATRAAPADTPDKAAPKILRYVSLRVNKANMRQGPSYSHRILWSIATRLSLRRHQRIQILAQAAGPRRRRRLDEFEAMLSDRRTVLITGKGRAPLRPSRATTRWWRWLSRGGGRPERPAPTALPHHRQDIDGWIARTASGVWA